MPGYSERRFSVDEFDRLGELGFLGGPEHYELWEGRIVMSPPAGGRHGNSDGFVSAQLLFTLKALGLYRSRYIVVPNTGLQLSDQTLVGPDIMVVETGEFPDRTYYQPETVKLCVEIADSSVEGDLGVKKGAYADADIAEYWVLDTRGKVLHTFREPDESDYRRHQQLRPGQSVSPLFEPRIEIAVGDLF